MGMRFPLPSDQKRLRSPGTGQLPPAPAVDGYSTTDATGGCRCTDKLRAECLPMRSVVDLWNSLSKLKVQPRSARVCGFKYLQKMLFPFYNIVLF